MPKNNMGSAATYRMPAEWEPHEATWLTWPHSPTDWPGKLAPIHWVYGEMVRKLVAGERVHVLVNDARHEAQALKVLKANAVDLTRVGFFRIPTNRGWNRDFGPIFVYGSLSSGTGARKKSSKNVASSSHLAMARFRFNGWGKYANWQKDDKIPDRLSKRLHIPSVPIIHKGRAVVLEGGAIEVNGKGTLITTEECLLDAKRQVRNPGFTRSDYEDIFRLHLGIQQTIWLGNGIAGDDTHGHVDDICRFVNEDTVVVCQESNRKEVNYAALADNRKRLRNIRLASGKRLRIVSLPMPEPVSLLEERLPASYANFYIGNAVVLVPTFNDPNDRTALTILAKLFPKRKVVGIHSVDLVWGQGTIHCLTQQQPKAEPVS